ncbi:MAG: SRPBCC domain-containing protein, partial [Thermomicrobiales bacterium]
RVVFTWGTPCNDALPPVSSTVEILFNADGNETVVALFHHGLPVDERPHHEIGWASRLDMLRQVASS